MIPVFPGYSARFHSASWCRCWFDVNASGQVTNFAERGPLTGGEISGGQSELLYPPSYDECFQSSKPVVTRKDIYRDGWIDLNKNGKKDIYEDQTQPVGKRVDDLISQMTLRKNLPAGHALRLSTRAQRLFAGQKLSSALWKDGVANIDEQLTGYPYFKKNLPGVAYLWPASKHTWRVNEIQRFFIEDTRMPSSVNSDGTPNRVSSMKKRWISLSAQVCFDAGQR